MSSSRRPVFQLYIYKKKEFLMLTYRLPMKDAVFRRLRELSDPEGRNWGSLLKSWEVNKRVQIIYLTDCTICYGWKSDLVPSIYLALTFKWILFPFWNKMIATFIHLLLELRRRKLGCDLVRACTTTKRDKRHVFFSKCS